MKKRLSLGSNAWLEEVFASEPARDPSGRSRPTQRYLIHQSSGEPSVAEGGNTATARSLLTTMLNAGVVKRLKLEPFQLNRADHGIDATPDVIFQTCDSRVFVVETKASKYLTEEKLSKQRQVESVITQSGMTYLFWTDAWPLSSVLWRQLRETRRLGTSEIPRDQIWAVAQAVAVSPKTIEELRQLGLYRQYVLAAVWLGQVHMDLFSQLSEFSLVSTNPLDRRFNTVLNASVKSYEWWGSLTAARLTLKEDL
jgi:hypothetical protein